MAKRPSAAPRRTQWTEPDARRVLAERQHSGDTLEAFARSRGLVPQRLVEEATAHLATQGEHGGDPRSGHGDRRCPGRVCRPGGDDPATSLARARARGRVADVDCRHCAFMVGEDASSTT
jgi:hypothetical protein